MNTDEKDLKHHEITRSIIGIFYQVYNEMGYGFLEAAYTEALSVALRSEGMSIHRELPINVRFRGCVVGRFRADVVVNGKVLIEVKALPTNTELFASNGVRGGSSIEFWSSPSIQAASIR